jgi:hypothetical protein
LSAVEFADIVGDALTGLQLRPESPYANIGTDGKAPGADNATIAAAIAGVAQ